jgi:predicted  nucleic acid-binding Zn-ribbon protein
MRRIRDNMLKKKNQIVVLTEEQKVQNVINHYSSELASLQNESDNILDVFKNTVKRLENINSKIDSKVSSIEMQMEKMAEIKAALVDSKAANEKVKARFVDFLA